MKAWKKALIILLVLVALLAAVFLAGRYGWKLFGFRACQDAGITAVEVSENAVHITGFYPGSFPEGFCGYYAQEQDGKLYVGFRFSAVFGFFEPGDFDITIPTQGPIDQVILKTNMVETSVWNSQTGSPLTDYLSDCDNTTLSVVYCSDSRCADFYFAENYEQSYGLLLQDKGGFLKREGN